MKTNLYKINVLFTRENKLPCYFVGVVLKETPRATFIYGRGTLDTQRLGVCCVCGRTLTHPVSIELGIGPECGNHFHNWDLVGGYSKENAAAILQMVQSKIIINQWIPKSCIKDVLDTKEIVTPPADHQMTQPSTTIPHNGRKASLVKFQTSGEHGIKIEFPFSHVDVANVKTLLDRRFHSEGKDKYWTVPLSERALLKLQEWGFELSENLRTVLTKKEEAVQTAAKVTNDIPGLKHKLFPFQTEGVKFIESRQGRALVADEMGLGKTVQALAWLQLHPELRPAIIVVPASLKLNWKKEAEAWMENPQVQVISGTNLGTRLTGEILIINYDIVGAWVDTLVRTRPRVIIMDEVHYTKNKAAQRSKAVRRLTKGIPHVIGLSGTPIVNRPAEAYNTLTMISPNTFPKWWDFAHRYCGAKHNGFGWDFEGSSNADELHKLLTNTVMIRRKKADVLTELPDKVYSFVPMEMDNRKTYERAEQDFIQFVFEQKGKAAADRASNAQALAEIEGLKQLAVQGKMKSVITWVQDFLESGEKLVLMATHKYTIDTLMMEFKDIAVKVDGSVGQTARQEVVELFQQSADCRLFIGNIKAAGVGLTLTAASTVAFVELPWTPGDLVQAADRCHRIGQKNTVNIHYLLADRTIEDKIASMLDSKSKVLNAVLDGEEVQQSSLLKELMYNYK